jgi:hypothetical protein
MAVLVGAAAGVLAPALLGVRDTLTAAVDLGAAAADAACVVDGLKNAQPDEPALLAFLAQVGCVFRAAIASPRNPLLVAGKLFRRLPYSRCRCADQLHYGGCGGS